MGVIIATHKTNTIAQTHTAFQANTKNKNADASKAEKPIVNPHKRDFKNPSFARRL
jgi:hypothetical protein